MKEGIFMRYPYIIILILALLSLSSASFSDETKKITFKFEGAALSQSVTSNVSQNPDGSYDINPRAPGAPSPRFVLTARNEWGACSIEIVYDASSSTSLMIKGSSKDSPSDEAYSCPGTSGRILKVGVQINKTGDSYVGVWRLTTGIGG